MHVAGAMLGNARIVNSEVFMLLYTSQILVSLELTVRSESRLARLALLAADPTIMTKRSAEELTRLCGMDGHERSDCLVHSHFDGG